MENDNPIQENEPERKWGPKVVNVILCIVGLFLTALRALMIDSTTNNVFAYFLGAFLAGVITNGAIAFFISLIRTKLMKRENGLFWIWFAVIAFLFFILKLPTVMPQ